MSDQLGFTLEKDAEEEVADAAAVPEKAAEPVVLSVAALNGLLREQIEDNFGRVYVRGEISNFKPHSSGHWYFSLKDETSQISAAMFRGANGKIKFKPDNGMEVLVRGKVSVYEPRGTYSIIVETMEPVGAGALQKAFEQLKAKLQAEGLFDQARKRPLPAFPKHIGIVSSPTGAAIKDILNVLRRRYKAAQITLAPAVVQGDAAPASIVSAIKLITQLKDVDVLIVGRGGGSIEDLWCFNDEAVARAIAASPIPTISAVGHEIDFTIADFVADVRAPTPSAAAELVVKNASDLAATVTTYRERLMSCMRSHFEHFRRDVKNLSGRLIDPQRRLQDLNMRNDELSSRLENAVTRYLEVRRTQVNLALQMMGTPREYIVRLQKRLESSTLKMRAAKNRFTQNYWAQLRELMGKIDSLSPLRTVERGFSVVKDVNNKILTDVKKIKIGDSIKIELARGSAEAKVTSVSPTGLVDQFKAKE
jgi:exodeoxyribonuclease VII large subunit